MVTWTATVFAAMRTGCSAVEKEKKPTEVGAVGWLSSDPVELKVTKTSNKPLFLLFQEVSG